ncbi:endolytic transglycosylase MltG, partial [Mesorhizobium sp.]|uniref:endolytic transglycosylase MltG n=1 Tax=Mesorhizobium sp. TaxID=1871066 RepID=UPI0025C2E119
PALPIANMEDFVILASIVEKETGRGDERSRVAAVFLNRLAKGMRLQSDPTIIYGLFGGKGKPADRPIYQSDIEKQTPYNTYLIKGLPPTPIANPGRAALEAVANPSKTDDLYFVADGNGGHVFAATLEEHNQNVARYRAVQKKQADAAAKASGQTTAPATPDDGASAGASGENGDAAQ